MTDSIMKRLPIVSLAAVLMLIGSTILGAAANMCPSRMPTAREIQLAKQAEVAAARRERIASLQAAGDGCRVTLARELARELVFDGRSAIDYANDFESRCGGDLVVRHWAEARRYLRVGTYSAERNAYR